MAPSFQAPDIILPLPADDAAWDAPNSESCAEALDLRGTELQLKVNTTGSLRLKSLELHHAIQALHSPLAVIRPRTTNVYSKFILIHAIRGRRAPTSTWCPLGTLRGTVQLSLSARGGQQSDYPL
jgi:hypothetical protein